MGVEWGTTATRLVRFAPTRKAYEKKEKNNVVSLGFVCGDGNDEFYSSFTVLFLVGFLHVK